MEKAITASIPEHLCSFLRPGKEGEILLVTSAGIYLRFEEQILLLCDAHWDVVPIGISLDNFAWATGLLQLRQGQRIRVEKDHLQFPFGKVGLSVKQQPCENKGETIPQIAKIRQAAEELAALRRQRGISMLVLPLVLGQKCYGEWTENPYCSYACCYLDNLITAFACCDGDKIRSSTEKLLGLGQGLTPSADDVLLGMLYVFRTLAPMHTAQTELFQKTIAQLCDQRTNQISAAYLKAMISGAPFERMEQVFRGLCGKEILDIGKLTQIGSSSGSEMLLGMLIALRSCGYDVSQKEDLP